MRLRNVIGRRLLFRLLVADVIAFFVVTDRLGREPVFQGGQSLQGTLGGLLGVPIAIGAVVLVSIVVVGLSVLPEYLRAHHPQVYRLVGGANRQPNRVDQRHAGHHDDRASDDEAESFLGGVFGSSDGGFDLSDFGGGGGGDGGGGGGE